MCVNYSLRHINGGYFTLYTCVFQLKMTTTVPPYADLGKAAKDLFTKGYSELCFMFFFIPIKARNSMFVNQLSSTLISVIGFTPAFISTSAAAWCHCCACNFLSCQWSVGLIMNVLFRF